MPKVVIKGARILADLLTISLFLLCFCLLIPSTYVYEALNHTMLQTILTGDNYLTPVALNTISGAAIHHFPIWLYTSLMASGGVLMVIAAFIAIRGLIVILTNVGANNPLTVHNVAAFKRLITAEIITIIADFCLASGNQLTASWLFRINNGLLNTSWHNLLTDLLILMILLIATGLYQHTVNLHVATATDGQAAG